MITPIVDGHLDLAYLALQGVRLEEPSPDPDRVGVTLPALRAGGVRLVFATIFTEWVEERPPDPRAPWEYAGPPDVARSRAGAELQMECYEVLERAGRLSIVRSADDLERAWSGARLNEHGKTPIAALILMECADPIEAPSELEQWVRRGVRAIGPSWAKGSRYAGGNARPGGVTPFGRDFLREMERLGVILDCSHLADRAVDEALDLFGGCVMASHSNARALLGMSQRHLRDDHAKRIAERGGVVGLNLFGRFLAEGRTATIDDVRRHLDHWREWIGVEHLGLGSDFDGGFTPLDCPRGAQRPEDLQQLLDGLRTCGWSEREVRAFAGESWIGFLRRALGGEGAMSSA
ncbi:MAG: membrane dipeptidase [Phycisphaeraceae bacterium]|nr:membrane dipeptidase [Phycisphaeraceae bacterium]